MINRLNIFVAGSSGMVGSAIVRKLRQNESLNLITSKSSELNFLNQDQVRSFFQKNKIDQVYLSAAKVGGIMANNSYPADFIFQNLMIQNNIINEAFSSGVKKLLFLGSSCIYPKYAQQPLKEEYLLSGGLEPTNEPYAIAKIAGIKMCESYNRQHNTDFRSVMPTNLYGLNDNYHDTNSHVVPALIRRFHESKINDKDEIKIWGSGEARREFLYVDDMAEACIFLMNLQKDKYENYVSDMVSHINIGSGTDISIKELAIKIQRIVGFKGKLIFDKTKQDGTPQKLLDISKIKSMGWSAKIDLDTGIKIAYDDFIKNKIRK